MDFMKVNIFFNNIEKPIAFVLGQDSINILGIIRSLAKVNIPTIVLSSKCDKQIFFFSKYSTVIECPDSKNNEKQFIEFLVEIGEKLKIKGVLFPTNDIDLYVLLKNKDVLEKYFNFPMTDLDVVGTLLDKRKFYNTLEKQGIYYPKTYIPNDMDDIMKAIKEISFPCILKPSNSSYFRIDFHKKFFICRTKEELLYYYHKGTERNHKFVIQEIIPGDANKMYGFNAYYDHNFIAHGIFTYNRIREWPILAGNGCFIQNKWVPELEEIITPIMKKIKYYGIIDAEFKKDSRDNLYKLIEINPRIWLQNSFPTQCGINIPAMAYMDTIGKDMDEATMTKDVMKWLDCNDDIKAAVIDIKKGTLSFHEWIHSYYGQVNQAIFTREDPFPSIVNFIYFFYVKLLYSYPRKMLRGWSD